MSDKIIHVQTESWMEAVENKDGVTAYIIGTVKEMPDTLAVAIQGTGATRFYCKKHQRIYHMLLCCQDCAGIAIPDMANNASVMTSNAG
jgi:hypothetical protein